MHLLFPSHGRRVGRCRMHNIPSPGSAALTGMGTSTGHLQRGRDQPGPTGFLSKAGHGNREDKAKSCVPAAPPNTQLIPSRVNQAEEMVICCDFSKYLIAKYPGRVGRNSRAEKCIIIVIVVIIIIITIPIITWQ